MFSCKRRFFGTLVLVSKLKRRKVEVEVGASLWWLVGWVPCHCSIIHQSHTTHRDVVSTTRRHLLHTHTHALARTHTHSQTHAQLRARVSERISSNVELQNAKPTLLCLWNPIKPNYQIGLVLTIFDRPRYFSNGLCNFDLNSELWV